MIEALSIRNKRALTIVGAGSSGANATELLGPIPDARDPVADPDAARRVINVIDSSVEIDVVLRGFDAGIVGRQTEATRRADPTNRFRNLAIRHTRRGILWKSRGKLDVSDTTISDVAKNGISLAPTFAPGVGGSLLKFNLGSIIFFPVPTNDGDWGTGIIASAFGSGRSLVTLADNEIKRRAQLHHQPGT